MPNRDDRITLRQMLDHAREAVALVQDLKRDELDGQRVLCLALIQLCQIVGKAATRVSKETQARHAEISWAKITSLRNRLIHGYDVIDYDIFLAHNYLRFACLGAVLGKNTARRRNMKHLAVISKKTGGRSIITFGARRGESFEKGK